MKPTTEDLILAAAIRPIAIELRAQARKTAKEQANLGYRTFDAPPIGYTETQRLQIATAEASGEKLRIDGADFDKQWNSQHKLVEFVIPALQELQVIAAAVNSYP